MIEEPVITHSGLAGWALVACCHTHAPTVSAIALGQPTGPSFRNFDNSGNEQILHHIVNPLCIHIVMLFTMNSQKGRLGKSDMVREDGAVSGFR